MDFIENTHLGENPFGVQADISNHNEYILNSLYSFYGSVKNIEPSNEIMQILPILSGQSVLSIRVIDWFVTNYSKKKNIIYTLQHRNNIPSYFNVYLDYKSQLKGYKKKLFDPFCRKRRIPFYYTSEKCLITTIGQLIFFRWAISNKVLDYIILHFNDINTDMNETIKNKSSKSSSASLRSNASTSTSNNNDFNTDSPNTLERKRHELSVSASKTINCHKMKIILDMN
jgi:hypothetical protein